MKLLRPLRRLWFPRLRAARAEMRRLLVAAAWAEQRHKRAVHLLHMQRQRMQAMAARNLALREENENLDRALAALTKNTRVPS